MTLLYRNDFEQGGRLSTSPAPAVLFADDFEHGNPWSAGEPSTDFWSSVGAALRVPAGVTAQRALYPVSGGRRMEFGGMFAIEGAPTQVKIEVAYGAFSAALVYEDDVWRVGSTTLAEGLGAGRAWQNFALVANFADGEWVSALFNGQRVAPSFTPPMPDEPEWPDAELVLARHREGLDDSNLARDLAMNSEQALLRLETEKADWKRHNTPSPSRAPLGEGLGDPFFRFAISCDGKGSALVLDRVWGVA